ncbi:MAG: sodium-dependent transporter [Lentisphaeria bacterium]|nr:sodium-dependent transporter [Lentisphaeria bacterium]
MTQNREQFASRLGFILMTAGCAIGLGNVWRFPYVAGAYGGGLFVALYLFFLAVLGFPVMVMELAAGRAARSTLPGALRTLGAGRGRFKWHIPGYVFFSGNLILLMYYTVISGWLLAYALRMLSGGRDKLTPQFLADFTNRPGEQTLCTLVMLSLTVLICLGGVRNAIEKSIKVMMGGLFLLLSALTLRSLCLPGAAEGITFFLWPSLKGFAGGHLLETVHAAMAQAFFTLSLGIGSIMVCGSYFGRERSLPGEGLWIIFCDTLVALCSGLVIFPACRAYGISPDAGPSLIFITLPRVFQNMPAGAVWGTAFFIFLAVAAFSTLVAVFENLAAFGMDELKWSRKKSCFVFGAVLAVLSLPCILGFNVWKHIRPLGKDSCILDLEDFIVSDNLLPLGALFLAVFCTSRYGWGIENFYGELNAGQGVKFPRWAAFYLKWILPVIIFAVWAAGMIRRFC